MEQQKEVAVDEAKREFANYAFVTERSSENEPAVAGVIQFRNQTELNQKMSGRKGLEIVKIIRGYPLEARVETQIRLL